MARASSHRVHWEQNTSCKLPTGHYKAKSSISEFYFDLFYPQAAKARFQKSNSFKLMGKRRSVMLRTGIWDGLGGKERERGSRGGGGGG